MGCTPERLFLSKGSTVVTEALAGTRGRGGTPAEDERLGEDLMGSDKVSEGGWWQGRGEGGREGGRAGGGEGGREGVLYINIYFILGRMSEIIEAYAHHPPGHIWCVK